jgi:hypothetical protein
MTVKEYEFGAAAIAEVIAEWGYAEFEGKPQYRLMKPVDKEEEVYIERLWAEEDGTCSWRKVRCPNTDTDSMEFISLLDDFVCRRLELVR